MHEPENHTVVLDRDGDTWVRYDEWPGMLDFYTWRHISTGDCWDVRARGRVGQARPWYLVLESKPFLAGPEQATAALAQVAQAWQAH